MSYLKSIMYMVYNLEKMVSFFRDVLEFEEMESWSEKGESLDQLYHLEDVNFKCTRMRLGSEEVHLVQWISHQGKVFPLDSLSSDLWFQHIAIVVSDMEKAYRKLMEYGVTPISEHPQTIPDWNASAAGIKAFYFRSPDYHPLELIFFPEGKGRVEWQNKKKLFLGIDHTAIAVEDTESSQLFYQMLFGLKKVGESLNDGSTQERLTSVPNAKVKITTLRDPEKRGIGVEFLQYLEGIKGRKMHRFAHDIAATKMIFETEDVDGLMNKVKEAGSFTLSPEGKKALLSDPDGHFILVQTAQQLSEHLQKS